jgi:predicted phage-related endonuclease
VDEAMTATLVQVPEYGSEEWVARRRDGVGASDVAAVVDLDRWRSSYELALEKRGESEDSEMTWAMRMGHIMEPYGLDAYERERGVTLTRGETFHNDRWPRCWATLDGRCDDVGVEVKWTNAWRDEVPRHIIVQVYAQMGIADLRAVDIVRISSRDAPEVVTTIERDERIITDLLDTAEAWYLRYVAGDELPPVDGSRGASRHLDRQRGPEEMQADAEQAEMVRQLADLRARMTADKDTERLIVNRLKDSMAGAEALVGDRFRVSWRRSKPRRTTDWHAVASHYRSMVQAPPETLDEIEQRHTEEKEGSRPFRLTTEEAT